MRRRVLILVLCMVVGTVVSGCFIQSLQPFYAEPMRVEVPDLIGEWRLVRAGSDDVTTRYPQPWLFTSTVIQTYDKGVPSPLRVVWFKVGDTLFADLSADERAYDGKLNAWWSMHAVPVHSVCKVLLDGDTLSLIPLDGDWLLKGIARKEIVLAHSAVDGKGDHSLLTAPTEELIAFLKKYQGNPEAFPDGNAHVFRLVKRPQSPGRLQRVPGN